MRFVCTGSEFNDYMPFFEAIIEHYMNLFEDSKLFKSKLSFAQAKLNLVSTNSKAEIRCLNTGFEIWMDINPYDKKEYILHQFGHELAHLLLMPMRYNPCIGISYVRGDESYAITTLTRKTGSVTYGILFEEAFCNWLSLKAINSIMKKDYTNSFFISKADISLVDLVVGSFEMSLHSKWDSLDRSLMPANPFLFGIAAGDISYAISMIDSFMGKNTWKELMHSAYIYLTDQSVNKQKEAYWQIKLCLKEFKKLLKASLKERKYA